MTTAISDTNFQTAVDLWVSNQTSAIATYGDISGWDVSLVTNMSSAFSGKNTFNSDISNWVVSAVTDMSSMFNGATSFNKLLSWNLNTTVSVTDMFQGSVTNYDSTPTLFEQTIGGIVYKRISYYFADRSTLKTAVDAWISNSTTATATYGVINTWDVSAVTDMAGLFTGTQFNSDISNWDVSAVINMSTMFRSNVFFNQDISRWDVSAVTNMSGMFMSTWDFNQDISSWNVSAVTNMGGMFQDNPTFNKDISGWERTNGINGATSTSSLSNVKYMYSMFQGTTFNGNIGNWNVSSVTNLAMMFYGATAFNSDISSWDVSSATNMVGMFYGATAFNIDISGWERTNGVNGATSTSSLSEITDMREMFNGATAFNSDISNWDVSAVTDMEYMFNGATSFNKLLSWNLNTTVSVIDMFQGSVTNYDSTPTLFEQTIGGIVYKRISYYFADKSTLETAVDAWISGQSDATATYSVINTWDVSVVTNMVDLFKNGRSKQSGIGVIDTTAFNSDISNWVVSAVTDMNNMFNGATAFNSDISTWAVSAVTDMSSMFNGAIAFDVNISAWASNGGGFTDSPILFLDIFQGATALNASRTALDIDTTVAITKANWATNVICFYGFVNVQTDKGLKQIKDLKRGDMIFTNDGYQPLAVLDVGFNPSNELLKRKFKTTDFIVKIPKDFLAENVPTEDVYVTKTHSLSVRITSDDKDFEYLHLFVEELMQLGDDIEYVRKDEETKLYNLIFDNHYEVNVGNMKFLSHHPNHNNGNKRLKEGNEIDPENRTKKVYADKNGIYFKKITLKNLLKDKPDEMTDKEYLVHALCFKV